MRTPQETVEIDPTGKRSGRGAYICPQKECLQKAARGKRLEKALERPVSQEILDMLAQRLVQ